MLLIDRMRYRRGLAALGPLLLTHVLPQALPSRLLPPRHVPGRSTASGTTKQQPVVAEVQHEEAPAIIDPETAATLVMVQEAGFVERYMGTTMVVDHLASSTETALDIGADELLWQTSGTFSPLLLMNFTRHPPTFEEAFLNSDLLREVREGLDREGTGWRTPHGVKVLVHPSQIQAALRAMVGLRVGASHVITSETLAPIVLAVVSALPRRESVTLKDVRVLAYTNGGEANGTVIIRNTFLDPPFPLRGSQQVVSSTTEAHRGLNPRRRAITTS